LRRVRDNALGNSTIEDFHFFVHENTTLNYINSKLLNENLFENFDATLVPPPPLYRGNGGPFVWKRANSPFTPK
jgi:hypothetical protein